MTISERCIQFVALIGSVGLMATSSAMGQTIPEIQSATHVSPLVGQVVTTEGVVTAIDFDGFYLQDSLGDGDITTSDALFVYVGDTPSVEVGQLVQINGTVSEFVPGGADTGNLSTTQLTDPTIAVLASGEALPAPIVIGGSGLVPPARDVISADEIDPAINLQDAEDAESNLFDPGNDGIDFFESLEGMLVIVEAPVAVSAVRTFDEFSSEFVTLPNDGELIEPSDALTNRGGLLLQPDPDNEGDQNPERVQIQLDSDLYPAEVPAIRVGDRFGDIIGVVGYSFGNFEVNATETLTVNTVGIEPETTPLSGDNDTLTVASYNVLNLSPDDSDANQLLTLGSHIADNLGGPDILALQEIQDNSGETDDGTIDATLTLEMLRDAVLDAGGPSYEFFDVAPTDNTSGGVPGGNIRNAFFYNPDRVELVDFYSLTPEALLDLGVSAPEAFVGTRDPLVGMFGFGDNEVIVVNNHLTSRFGSSPVFGALQPFVQAGETERESQLAVLNELTDLVLEEDPAANIVVLGDLNTFQFTNDLEEILPGEDKVLVNLVPEVGSAEGRDSDNIYTFIFEGNAQMLDHIFVSDGLEADASFDIVHVNVEFPRVDDTVGSDHEPMVVRLRLGQNQLSASLP